MENKNSQIEILKQDFNKLISEVEGATEKGKRIDQVESMLLTSLLAMGKHVLQLYIVLVKEKTEESLKKKERPNTAGIKECLSGPTLVFSDR